MVKNEKFVSLKISFMLLLCLVVFLGFSISNNVLSNNSCVNAEGDIFTITYKVAGETSEMLPEELNGNPTTYNVSDLPITTIKAPNDRNGYKFEGWCIDNSFNPLDYNETTQTYTIPEGYNSNIVLLAIFTPINYQINYLGLPDGVTKPTKTTYTIEERVDLSEIKPIIFGYSFDGWYEDSLLTIPKNVIEVGSTGNITIYAKYSEKRQTITFNEQFETINIRYGTNAYGENGVLNNLIPQKDGYTFDGWYTNPEFKASSFVSERYVFTSDVTLYAKWVKKGNPLWIYLSSIFAGITVILFICWLIFARPKIKD